MIEIWYTGRLSDHQIPRLASNYNFASNLDYLYCILEHTRKSTSSDSTWPVRVSWVVWSSFWHWLCSAKIKVSLRSPIVIKLRPYTCTSKHPPVKFKSEKEENEPHEVKPQDPMPIKLSLDRRALDSELSLAQSSVKFPEDKYVPLNWRLSTCLSIVQSSEKMCVWDCPPSEIYIIFHPGTTKSYR